MGGISLNTSLSSQIISFSVGKNAQDEALAEKCMFVATS